MVGCAADMKARIFITPRKAVRHPESEAVLKALQQHFQFSNASTLSIGAYYEIEFAGITLEAARGQAEAFAKRKANPIMQDYRVEMEA